MQGMQLEVDTAKSTVTIPLSYFDELAEKVATTTAKKIYMKIYDKERLEHDFDNKVYNVRLLLKNYRMLKEHAEIKAADISNISNEDISALEILDSFQNLKSAGKEELKLESIITSTLRTKMLVNYIDDMISIYKQMCYKSSKPEDLRRADVLDEMFLKTVERNANATDIVMELAEKWFVSERQIWRDLSDAVERLTALLFGIDGVSMLEDRKRRKAALSKESE